MATLIEVKNYFGYSTSQKFTEEWKELSEADKIEIKTLVGQELGK